MQAAIQRCGWRCRAMRCSAPRGRLREAESKADGPQSGASTGPHAGRLASCCHGAAACFQGGPQPRRASREAASAPGKPGARLPLLPLEPAGPRGPSHVVQRHWRGPGYAHSLEWHASGSPWRACKQVRTEAGLTNRLQPRPPGLQEQHPDRECTRHPGRLDVPALGAAPVPEAAADSVEAIASSGAALHSYGKLQTGTPCTAPATTSHHNQRGLCGTLRTGAARWPTPWRLVGKAARDDARQASTPKPTPRLAASGA